jgi:D-3-phosphoglycerate dehydrogenase
MDVVGFDPFLSAERAAEQGVELFRDLDEMLPRCDFVTVHTPLSDDTKGLINAAWIARMKPGVRIINCARGGIVDEADLAAAIESKHVAGAALDVFVHEPPKADCRLPGLPQVLSTPHLAASTDEAQEQVAIEAAEILSAFFSRNEVRHAVNMVAISAREAAGLKPYLDLAYRLGLFLAQLNQGKAIRGARLSYQGEAASRPTRLMTSAFTAGLLQAAIEEVNIVNADLLARERGIEIAETSTTVSHDFASMISVQLSTADAERRAAGTIFGNEFLRLVRLDDYQMDAFLDGLMLVYQHRDVPGLIGAIGTVFGRHHVNISRMALGRERNTPGGRSIAILNLDNEPNDAALRDVAAHPEVTGVQLVKLPPAGAPLPWLGL